MSLAVRIRRLLFSIPPDETTVAKRGFRAGDPQAKQRIERVGQTFVRGYHTALEVTQPEALANRLDDVPAQWRGFAYEGAAMGLTLLDFVGLLGGHRWEAFVNGPGDAHAYMVHVGWGWAAARIPWVRRNFERRLAKLDPLLSWLTLDGYGFHQGYFHANKHVRQQHVPRQLSGYARRAFDQGLGRSLWFVECTDTQRVAATIGEFPASRRGDLWSGIGLAATYANGADRAGLESLIEAAGSDQANLAQGAAFAAKARLRAGNPTPETELASEVLCGMSAAEAAAVTDQSLADLPPDDVQPAFEIWRQRVQTQLRNRESRVV